MSTMVYATRVMVATMLAIMFIGSYPAGQGTAAVIAGEQNPAERLSRNTVTTETGFGDHEFHSMQMKGLSGDGEAALQVAQMFRQGSNGVPQDDRRMLQWLIHASSLSNGLASYQLYQYFLEQRLDREAVFFEKRAIDQGYKPPPRLDPRRG
jgi:TPR repeat protein